MSKLAPVVADPKGLKQSSWKDFAIRFVFGGIITAAVGLVGKIFGPVVAGLFLAFPAILPASLTLVADHSNEEVAGRVAAGAELGSGGLMIFGLVVWWLAPRAPAWLPLLCAMAAWTVVSAALWLGHDLLLGEKGHVDPPRKQAVESSGQRWGVAKR